MDRIQGNPSSYSETTTVKKSKSCGGATALVVFLILLTLGVLACFIVGLIRLFGKRKPHHDHQGGHKGRQHGIRTLSPAAGGRVPPRAGQPGADPAIANQMAKYVASGANGGGGGVGAGMAPPGTGNGGVGGVGGVQGPGGLIGGNASGVASAVSAALYKGAPYGATPMAGSAPMAVASMGQWAATGNLTSPFGDTYPNNDVGVTEASNDPWSGSNMMIEKLMPSSWRTSENGTCGDMKQDQSEWAQWSPTRAKFENYVTASGSARMPLMSRVHNPTGGIRDLLRSQPPVPLSAQQITFNDSESRLQQIFDSSGIWPTTTNC